MSAPSWSSANAWRIDSADAAVIFTILGRWPANEPIRVRRGGSLSVQSGPGARLPVVQDADGGAESWSFSGTIAGRHNEDDVRADLEVLDRLAVPDATLGRRPRIRLEAAGRVIIGIVASYEDEDLGVWPATLLPRGRSFTLEVTEAPDVALEEAQLSPAGETAFVTLAAGESFESLARSFYGDPLLGVHIAAENPASVGDVGDLIRVLEADHPRVRAPVRPGSAAFTGAETVLEALGRSRGVTQLGVTRAQLQIGD